MAKITRFFENIDLAAISGTEVPNIINGARNVHTGTVEQIVIEATSGAPTSIDVEVRYNSGVSSRTKLVYLHTAGDMPLFVDSCIRGVFSLKNIRELDGDLYLYLLPDVDCTVDIRVDLDINNTSGL